MRAWLFCLGLCFIHMRAVGMETLWQAAERGLWAVVEQRLAEGADINARDSEGRTALLAAVAYQRLELLQPLLQRGADLKAKDNKGRGVLYLALRNGDRGVVRALLAAGAGLEVGNLSSFSPLMAALVEGDAEMVGLFLKAGVSANAEITFTNGERSPVVYLASRYGSAAALALTLDAGGNPNATESSYRNTCLMAAAGAGRLANVKLLLARGAKVRTSNKLGNSAAAFALVQKDSEDEHGLRGLCLVELLRAGDPLSGQRSELLRNLWLSGDAAVQRLAAGQGLALPHAQPVQEVLAAIQQGDLASVRKLHEQFEFNYNYEGHCFLPYALGTHQVPMMDLIWELSEHTARGKRARLIDTTETPLLHRAAMLDDVGMLDCFIQNGVDEWNKLRETPLMVASRLGRMKSLTRLLSAKPDVKLTDAVGRNALDLALLYGQEEAAALLKKAGLTPGAKVVPLPVASPDLLPLPAAALQAPLPGVTVAVVPFTMEPDAWWQSAESLRGVAALLQARLQVVPGVSWVERAELEKIEAEITLKSAGMQGAAQALAIGQRAQAELLLTAHVGEEDGVGRWVTLQGIEVRRADTVAWRRVHVPMQQGAPLKFTADQLAQLSRLSESLLQEARCRVLHAKKQPVVAPLFVGNRTAGTTRLDMAAIHLVHDFASLAAGRPLRVLQLQATAQAQAEVDLAVGGLTAGQVAAWQTVADAYCWGWCEESGAPGTPYELMPVKLSYYLWRKVGEPQLFSAEATVTTLPAVARELAARVLDAAQLKDIGEQKAAGDSALVGRALFEFGQGISLRNQAYLNGGKEQLGWPERWQAAVHALSAARFFTPEEPKVLAARLLVRWDRRQYLAFGQVRDTARFWWLWQRMTEWDETVNRLGAAVFSPLMSARQIQTMPPGLTNDLEKDPHWLGSSIISVHESLLQTLVQRRGGYPDDTPPELAGRWRKQVGSSLAKWYLTLAKPELLQRQYELAFTPLLLGELEPSLRLQVVEKLLDVWAVKKPLYYGLWNSERAHLLRYLDSLGGRQPYEKRFPGKTLVLDARPLLATAAKPTSGAVVAASRRFKIQPRIPEPPAAWSQPRVLTAVGDGGLAYLVVDMYLGSTREYGRFLTSYEPGAGQWKTLDAGALPANHFIGKLSLAAGHAWLPNGDTEVARISPQTGQVERLSGQDGLPIVRVESCVAAQGQAFFKSKDGTLASWHPEQGWSRLVLSPSGAGTVLSPVSHLMAYGEDLLLLRAGAQYRSPWWSYAPETKQLKAVPERVQQMLQRYPFAETGPEGIWAADQNELRCMPMDEGAEPWLIRLPDDLPVKWCHFLHDGPWLWMMATSPPVPTPAGKETHGNYHHTALMLIHKPLKKYIGCVDLGVSVGLTRTFSQTQDDLLLNGLYGQEKSPLEGLLLISKKEVLSQVPAP